MGHERTDLRERFKTSLFDEFVDHFTLVRYAFRMPKITVERVIHDLTKLYPGAKCTLDFDTPLQLLVATILSAQCTDARVNIVTKTLFKKYHTPQDYLSVPLSELEQDIFSCGTYRMKARAIRESMHRIITEFHGQVPRTMEEMLTLRGVGRKTAAIVLDCSYGVIAGIPVDTHVTRVSKRLGLTRHTEQAKIERDLMKQTPKEEWVHLSHLLVAHGRMTCKAPTPKCEECVFKAICPSSRARKNVHNI